MKEPVGLKGLKTLITPHLDLIINVIHHLSETIKIVQARKGLTGRHNKNITLKPGGVDTRKWENSDPNEKLKHYSSLIGAEYYV